MKSNKINICCIGAGYVGGPTMAVIAYKCPHIKVTVVDSDKEKINAWNGPLEKLPIFEKGLSQVVGTTRNKNLFFSTDIDKGINDCQIIFMAVNTPTKLKGKGAGMAADLSYVESCAKHISRIAKSDKIVVEKSTLPVRTAEKIKKILNQNKNPINFEVISNPEFLAEGTAIEDLFKSDRVLIGGDNTDNGRKAVKQLVDIYKNWIPFEKIITTNIWSSELSKLASNAMLAQRISSINSLSVLCEKTGANIEELSKAVGMDSRIGENFLKASPGFGGSCFQKDILNLVYLCQHYGLNEAAEYWMQVVKINDYQRKRIAKEIIDQLDNNQAQKKITLLGWAFKKNTNDSRESAAIYIADILISKNCRIHVFDPKVKEASIISDLKNLWLSKGFTIKEINLRLKNLVIHDSINSSISNSSGIVVLTEWDEFKNYNWKNLIKYSNTTKFIYDCRNILEQDNIPNNIKFLKIG